MDTDTLKVDTYSYFLPLPNFEYEMEGNKVHKNVITLGEAFPNKRTKSAIFDRLWHYLCCISKNVFSLKWWFCS